MEKVLEKNLERTEEKKTFTEKKPDWLKVRFNQEATEEVASLMKDLPESCGVL